MDVIILAEDPNAYLSHSEWVGPFGEALTAAHEGWGRVQSLRVLYRGGSGIRLRLTGVGTAPIDEGTRRVVADDAMPTKAPRRDQPLKPVRIRGLMALPGRDTWCSALPNVVSGCSKRPGQQAPPFNNPLVGDDLALGWEPLRDVHGLRHAVHLDQIAKLEMLDEALDPGT